MTAPIEYRHPHNWELEGSHQLKSPRWKRVVHSMIPWSASMVKIPWTEGDRVVNYENYKCKDCLARATKWIDDPKTQDKFVFNPSGGIRYHQLAYDTPCELAAKYRKFCEAADEFLDTLKNNKEISLFYPYIEGYEDRYRKHCVHILMQSWVNQCSHTNELVNDNLSDDKYHRLSCLNCGGSIIKEKTTDSDNKWYSDSGFYSQEETINKYINTHINRFSNIFKDVGEKEIE